MTNVLLRFPHGLGDVTQFSIVLKHLRRHRPGWNVDVVVGRGKHSILEGLCRRVFHDQEPEPRGPYDSIVDLGFYENYNRYIDKPNSKVTNCLAEVFGLGWDKDIGRYQVSINSMAAHRASAYLRSIGAHEDTSCAKFNAVILHYEGNTSPSKKNLGHWQAETILEFVIAAGRIPVLFDWDGRSHLPDNKRIFCPAVGNEDVWGSFGSGDSSTIAALINYAQAFVGIDSGPGKIASGVGTPSMICWRGHHPIQFHDPADNTVHMIPAAHRRLAPVCDESQVGDFFEKNYSFLTYDGEHDLATQVCRWLSRTLGVEEKEKEMKPLTFVLPNGIGDCIWALLKIKAIAGNRPIDIILSGDPRHEVGNRAVPFLKRFPFIKGVRVSDVPILVNKEQPTNSRGRYVYEADGRKGDYYFLVPNTTLEAGRRIEDWMKEYPIDYDVVRDFDWTNTERGGSIGRGMAPFVAFYLGPESGHTTEGHNRDWLWEPKHWVELGRMFRERGHTVCVIGANYDRSFWERYVRDGVGEAGQNWIDLIGQLEIGETFALLKEAKCLISYQCGLGIVNHYFGGKSVMWWRPDGNSCHGERMVSFDNQMKDAWIRPGFEKNYIGLLYLNESPGDIMAEIDRRGWLK
jgi:ADP-heptose:LPS heptosyltransferase